VLCVVLCAAQLKQKKLEKTEFIIMLDEVPADKKIAILKLFVV
jgi:ribosomal protein L7/L12